MNSTKVRQLSTKVAHYSARLFSLLIPIQFVSISMIAIVKTDVYFIVFIYIFVSFYFVSDKYGKRQN